MKTYQQFAKRLTELIGDSQAVRITVPGFMPLTVEELFHGENGSRHISLAHYGEQNGDAMRDPEIVFKLHAIGDKLWAEPVYFRNDYAGLEQFVYRSDSESGKTYIRTDLKRELKSFARLWFRNIRAQGFLDRDAVREVLS